MRTNVILVVGVAPVRCSGELHVRSATGIADNVPLTKNDSKAVRQPQSCQVLFVALFSPDAALLVFSGFAQGQPYSFLVVLINPFHLCSLSVSVSGFCEHAVFE